MISEKRRIPCGHVAARYFEPFTTLGLHSTELSPEIWIDPKTERRVESLVGGGRSLVVAISPGANRPTKRWSDEDFGALARLLTERRRARVVVVGDTKDMDVAARVTGIAGEETINLAGGTSLLELAAVLKRASLLVANDSGPMHVAAAVRTPVVALFGPTVPEFGFSPLGERDRIVEVDLPCRPCSLHGTERCGEGSLRCMRLITPDDVFKVVSEVLNGGQA
jgi:heptosyltransferase-2